MLKPVNHGFLRFASPLRRLQQALQSIQGSQQHIDAIRSRMEGAGRDEIQTALMPYRHLLPPGLRGFNARFGETD